MSKRYVDTLPKLDIRSKDSSIRDFLASTNNAMDGSAFVSFDGFNGHVSFEATRCNYGGLRYWWVCPSCGKRCAVLRLLDSWLECNSCTGKPFKSESITKTNRWVDQRRIILDRLGFDLHGLYDPLYAPLKPKHMHWRTFIKQLNRYNTSLNQEADFMNRMCVRANLPVIFTPA